MRLIGVAGACLMLLLAASAASSGGGDAAQSASAGFGDESGASAYVPSRTKPKSVVWAVGDGAAPENAGGPVSSLIGSRRMERFLYLGDVYETGTASEFTANYDPAFGRFDRRAAPTVGNHEWRNVATGYIPYWTQAKGSAPPEWYWFAASGWQLISLNSNDSVEEGSSQLNWLKRVVKANPRYGKCRLAFEHHPRFSGGVHGDDPDLEPVWNTLAGHARIFLSGHDHEMQRFAPHQGITQLVAGSGGRELYPVNAGEPGLVFFNDSVHGALKLTLTPTRAVGHFIATDGTVLDRFSVPC
ncbi:MAG: hypothetical protein EXQ70_04645 [Solirubrobacterales bacterium]|nr:hypothetical protein [Solirubrobacterales bacterium]